MIDVEIDYRAFRAFTANFAPLWAKSIERAFKAELFRLMGVMRQVTRAGVGMDRSLLTRAVSKRKTSRALSYVAQVTAYEYKRHGQILEGLVGPGAQTARRKKKVSIRFLEIAVGPKTITVTPSTQRAIARKMQEAGNEYLLRRGKRARRGKYKGAVMPRVGSRLNIPERHYATAIERAETTRSPENIARLAAMAMRGERWAR